MIKMVNQIMLIITIATCMEFYTGNLDTNSKDEVANKNYFGADSIVELQVIPETAPEGPEGITVTGTYKGLKVSWKAHQKAKDYDLYYRKIGTGAWIKANDPNDPKYVDSNTTNDVPDGAYNLKPEQKLIQRINKRYKL